ncbi:MAG: sulfatase [Anaerolineaceae bacterium]|nr:sulfatase [Anaerolineaceae bacterium]
MSRPNILLIHSHDTGRCIEPLGHRVRTPALMQMAQEGVNFRKAFCVAPMCSPARAGMMTGQMPHSCGMTGLAHRGFALNDYRQHLCYTLKACGYFTALVGVQHLARDVRVLGYDHLAALGTAPPGHPPGTVLDEPRAEDVVQAACEFFRNPPGQPFFLSLGFFETHRPFPHADTVDPDGAGEASVGDAPDALPDMAGFHASLGVLDEGIGAVLDCLAAAGLRDDTLVIFTSDHGPPFPGMKCTLSDLGLGVPLIVSGPGGFEAGLEVDAQVSHLDLFPTLCDLLDIPFPDWLQGKSLFPLLHGEQEQLHEALYAEINYHGAWEPQRSLRGEGWKYIRRFGTRREPVLCNVEDSPSKSRWMETGWPALELAGERLHDLIVDPSERVNLALDPAHEAVLEEMRRGLGRWMLASDDPLLRGRIPAPPGTLVNDPDSISPGEPLLTAEAWEGRHA